MHFSPVVAAGLFLALLAVAMEAKPAPAHLQKVSGRAAAAGPATGAAARGGGAKQEAKKGKGAAATSRLMRDLRTDSKRTRGSWGRMMHPEHQGSRRRKGPAKGPGCFGLKLDRIGAMSGLGC
uniref:C-type natriuretic peptide n=1 Tax=Salvator merianae TaxID=96440 RepID=A0A8D0DZK3_SALMN